MKFRKFKKIVSEHFEIEKAEKVGKHWFSAWAKSKYSNSKDTPNYQIQFKNDLWYVGGIKNSSLTKAYYGWLETHRQYLDKEIKDLEDDVDGQYREFIHSFHKVCLSKIVRYKRATVVHFLNGDKVQVKRCKGDKNDIYNAVAYAIIRQLYDSNSHYKRIVDKLVKKGEC